jgi:3-deoxy-manno-octulosonate cytidylyltransferase (CMP-KDO synthetase)
MIAGRPMISLVHERCLQIASRLPLTSTVHVATDSPEVARVVTNLGGQVLMTSDTHLTGTDRLAEAASLLGLGSLDIVLNVQGDQPAVNPDHPALLAQALISDPSLSMATLAVPMADPTEALDPNHVKVVTDLTGRALYFSRAPIPWPRDGGPGAYLKHIGLYAYRVDLLKRFVTWPRGRLEALENLEQLRALERSIVIKVLLVQGLSPEVDVPGDIAKAEAALKRSPGCPNDP